MDSADTFWVAACARSHLQTLLPLFLPLAADPLLLCSLSPAIFLHNRPRVSTSWWRCLTNSASIWATLAMKSNNSLFQLNQLLFFLFPAFKVNLDQGLELHQVLLHPFTMYILQRHEVHQFSSLICSKIPYWSQMSQHPEGAQWCLYFLYFLTYIKIHFFSIRNLWRDQVGHYKWPEKGKQHDYIRSPRVKCSWMSLTFSHEIWAAGSVCEDLVSSQHSCMSVLALCNLKWFFIFFFAFYNHISKRV